MDTPSEPPEYVSDAARRRWVGWIFFAAAMMILAGFWQVIVGLVALFDDSYFVVTNDGLLIIMLDVITIYALIVHGREVEDAYDM
jgi:hypothetical protein